MTGSTHFSDITAPSHEHASPAPQRARFIGFVHDEATAAILNAAFEPIFPHGSPFHVVPFRGGLSILSQMATPEVVLIDISGEDQPLNAMADLAEAVEAGTTILLIGEARDLTFYRATVNGMGVKKFSPNRLPRPPSRSISCRTSPATARWIICAAAAA
jgi:pilus assembly protein CpaE